LSSRILEDQFSSPRPCPCPRPRKFKSWKIFSKIFEDLNFRERGWYSDNSVFLEDLGVYSVVVLGFLEDPRGPIFKSSSSSSSTSLDIKSLSLSSSLSLKSLTTTLVLSKCSYRPTRDRPRTRQSVRPRSAVGCRAAAGAGLLPRRRPDFPSSM